MNSNSMTPLLSLLPPKNSGCKAQNYERGAGVGLLHRDLLKSAGKVWFRVQTKFCLGDTVFDYV